MPYIRDPDFERVIEGLEAIREFSDDENIKNHTRKILKILKGYRR